jgi:hypothetical protein
MDASSGRGRHEFQNEKEYGNGVERHLGVVIGHFIVLTKYRRDT